jgi:hemerythrin-like domain-containing protein
MQGFVSAACGTVGRTNTAALDMRHGWSRLGCFGISLDLPQRAGAGNGHAERIETGSLYAGERSEVQTMTHPTLRIIRDEHRALSAMLRSITLLLSEHRRRNTLPDFSVLRAMLFYVDEFPERLHHKKESKLLFPKLRARTTEAAAVLDRLERDHQRGEQAIRYLEHDLLGFEMMGQGTEGALRRELFERSMKQYVNFYLDHMHVEETEVLPLAEKVLTAQDWAELDAAFTKNCDPLTGHEPDDAYRPLFKKILNTLAAPFGLGPALEAMSVTGSAEPEAA